MPICDNCFALPLAVGNDSNFNFVSGEPWRQNHVRHLACFRVIGAKQPKSFFPLPVKVVNTTPSRWAPSGGWMKRGAQLGDHSTSRTGPKRGVTSATEPFNMIANDWVRCSSDTAGPGSALTSQTWNPIPKITHKVFIRILRYRIVRIRQRKFLPNYRNSRVAGRLAV